MDLCKQNVQTGKKILLQLPIIETDHPTIIHPNGNFVTQLPKGSRIVSQECRDKIIVKSLTEGEPSYSIGISLHKENEESIDLNQLINYNEEENYPLTWYYTKNKTEQFVKGECPLCVVEFNIPPSVLVQDNRPPPLLLKIKVTPQPYNGLDYLSIIKVDFRV